MHLLIEAGGDGVGLFGERVLIIWGPYENIWQRFYQGSCSARELKHVSMSRLNLSQPYSDVLDQPNTFLP